MKLKKRILRPGSYTVPRKDGTKSRVYIGPQRLRKIVKNFKAMNSNGLQIPAPWRHDPKALPVRIDGDQQDIDAFQNAGFWEKLWVSKSDGALYGVVDVPLETDAKKLGKTVTDVSALIKPSWTDGAGNEYEDGAVTHIALVTHPVAKDNKTFEPADHDEQTVALSLDDWLFADDADMPRDKDPTDEVNASTARVSDVVKMLGSLDPPIVLPDDTSVDNILERLVTAIAAIKGTKESEDDDDEGSVKEPPKSAKEQPGPVAMSKEFELALSLLGAANINNPATGKPWTQAELKAKASEDENIKVETALSAEDQATINYARNVAQGVYKQRVEACVKQGKITPKMAKETAAPLLEDLKLSFDLEGKQVKGPLDMVLEAWEAIPAGMTLNGNSPTTVKGQKGAIFSESAFSLSAGLTEEEPPEADFNEPLTDDAADQIVNMQMTQAGKSSHQIEGGLQPAQ